MLKHLFIPTLSICLLTSSLNAQNLPQAGDKQIQPGVAGNSAMIVYKKFISETKALRFGGNVSYVINNQENVNNGLKINTKNNSINMYGLVGIQKSYNVSDKFAAYTGIDFSLGFGYNNNESNSQIIDSSLYNKTSDRYSNRRTISQNSSSKRDFFSINSGLIPFLGFNYYLTKNFSIGAECRFHVVGVTYGLPSESRGRSSGSYLLSKEYDTNSNQYSFKNAEVKDSEPYENIYKTTKNFNIGGSFQPTIYITANFYFK